MAVHSEALTNIRNQLPFPFLDKVSIRGGIKSTIFSALSFAETEGHDQGIQERYLLLHLFFSLFYAIVIVMRTWGLQSRVLICNLGYEIC